MSMSDFALTYEISPIILTGGAAANVAGGMIPIVSLTESSNFDTGLLSGGDADDTSNFFAHFVPMPGATLIDQDIGRYAFANQAVAANAVITKPLVISMKMICPARGENGGYANKLAVLTALQKTIAQHNLSGGTYTVVTPSFSWENLVMLTLRDISANASAQPQTEWQWDFYQPLLTQQQANQAQNNLMSKASAGTQIQKADDGGVPWSSVDNTVGNPPSLAATSVVPAASGASGAQVSGPQSPIGTPTP